MAVSSNSGAEAASPGVEAAFSSGAGVNVKFGSWVASSMSKSSSGPVVGAGSIGGPPFRLLASESSGDGLVVSPLISAASGTTCASGVSLTDASSAA